jgi:hypothetical protein
MPERQMKRGRCQEWQRPRLSGSRVRSTRRDA